MKIGNLYNLESFAKFTQGIDKIGFGDSYSGTVLERQLTAVDPNLFRKKYPELTFVNSGIDVSNIGGFANIIQSLRVQDLGGFRTAGDNSSDKGKISLAGEQSTIKVIERQAESDWSDSEIKQAELEGINLPNEYVKAHNGIYLREVDEIGLTGVEGNEGLLNNTTFASTSATDVAENLTPKQLYDEIANMIRRQWNRVNSTPQYKGKMVYMPERVYNLITTEILDTAASTKSVLTALQDNFKDVKFTPSFRAEDAGPGGVSITMIFSTNPEAMKMRIPLALQIGKIIQLKSFTFNVESKYRIAGLDILESTAGEKLTGL